MNLSKTDLIKYFETIAIQRNHSLVSVEGKTIYNSTVSIECQRCSRIFTKKSENYLRANIDENEFKKQSEQYPGYFYPYGCPTCLTAYKRKLSKRNFLLPDNYAPADYQREGYNITEYKKWRRGIFHLYHGQCFITGKRGNASLVLQAHHLDAWSVAPDKRYDLNNGVLISEHIHMEFHRLYGNKVTKKLFENFCTEMFNITIFPWETEKNKSLQVSERIEKQPEILHKKMLYEIAKRNYFFVDGYYINKQSQYVIFCKKHQKFHTVIYFNFMRASLGLPCCSSEENKKNIPPSQKGMKRSKESLEKKAKTLSDKHYAKLVNEACKRGHEVIEGAYESKNSEFKVFCKKHNHSQTIIYHNYMRSIYGLSCCKRNE